MKKEVVVSVISLVCMVLFTTGTTFLFFKKRSDFGVAVQEKAQGVQIGFDDFKSYVMLDQTNNTAVETYNFNLYTRYQAMEKPGRLLIKFLYDKETYDLFKNNEITYQILDENNLTIKEEQPLNIDKDNDFFETVVDSNKTDYIYKIIIKIGYTNYENDNKGNLLLSKISAEVK